LNLDQRRAVGTPHATAFEIIPMLQRLRIFTMMISGRLLSVYCVDANTVDTTGKNGAHNYIADNSHNNGKATTIASFSRSYMVANDITTTTTSNMSTDINITNQNTSEKRPNSNRHVQCQDYQFSGNPGVGRTEY
jgi:hypothetical protein